MNRTLLAFLVAPLWTPLAVGLALALLWRPGMPPASHLLFATGASLIAGYVFTFVLGWPLFWLSRDRPWLFVTLGMLISVFAWSLFDIGFSLTIDETGLGLAVRSLLLEYRTHPDYLILPLVLGALVSFTIRAIAGPKAPR